MLGFQVRKNLKNICGLIHALRDPSYLSITDAQSLNILDMNTKFKIAEAPELYGRLKREGYMPIYTQLIHFFVQKKLTQHCKTIILNNDKKN